MANAMAQANAGTIDNARMMALFEGYLIQFEAEVLRPCEPLPERLAPTRSPPCATSSRSVGSAASSALRRRSTPDRR